MHMLVRTSQVYAMMSHILNIQYNLLVFCVLIFQRMVKIPVTMATIAFSKKNLAVRRQITE